jgi:glycosyltransferase involved in cell wall biosynthesis
VLAIDGAIREVVEGAGCGIFAQPGDPLALAEAIRTLADDREQARAMGLRGREYVEANFERGKLAEELAVLMERMGGEAQ